MTSGRVATVAALVLAVVGGYQLTKVDWAAYGPAEPPDGPEHVDTSLVTLRSVQLGDFDALNETPSFTWSQFVPVEIKVDCVPDRFRIHDPRRRLGDPVEHPQRFLPSLGLEIVRRSSLGEGAEVAYTTVSGARVNRNNEMSWSHRTWIPHVPGTYRVRVVLHYRYRDDNNDPQFAGPIVIGTFDLNVLPGEPAA